MACTQGVQDLELAGEVCFEHRGRPPFVWGRQFGELFFQSHAGVRLLLTPIIYICTHMITA